jgi:hypothetical protein
VDSATGCCREVVMSNVGEPVAVLGVTAVDDVKKRLLHTLRDGATCAAA